MLRREFHISQFFLLAVAFSSGFAADNQFGLKLTTESSKPKGNTQYTFHYFVKDDKTGDYKSQKETKEGDSVHGSYTMSEPNGNLRTVTYKAGPRTGFEAKVDVKSSGTVTKHLETTGKIPNTEKLQSSVTRFPGGFRMDVASKPQSETKTEMGIKFSLKTDSVTEPVTDSTNAVEENKTTRTNAVEGSKTTRTNAVEESKTTRTNAVEERKTTRMNTAVEMTTESLESSGAENATVSTEARETTEDPIEKEIDEVINSMPKLPELVLSDNKTHFKFYKDPEEALLDERITQIARQLAETSLRREYEERKLGHFIPISVSSVEPSTASFLSKSFRFLGTDHPDFSPSEPSSLHVLTQLRVVPQYIYRQTLLPPFSHRLPVVSKHIQKTPIWEEQTQEAITNPPDILKIINTNKKKETKLINRETPKREPMSMMPVHAPTFLQFFTPYMMHTPGNYVPRQESIPESATTVKTWETPAYDTVLYSPVTVTTGKP